VTGLTQQLYQTIVPTLVEKWHLIFDEIHIAAYLLDPRFRGNYFIDQDYLLVEKYLQQLTTPENWQSVSQQFLKFHSKEGIYSEEIELEGDPKPFWQRLKLMQSANMLANIALGVLEFPQTGKEHHCTVTLSEFVTKYKFIWSCGQSQNL